MRLRPITVRRFLSYPEAHLARASLAAAKIPAYLADDEMIALSWHLSNAIGGIRLIVVGEYAAARANNILNRDHSAALDGIPEWNQPVSCYEACPSCGVAGSQAILEPSLGRRLKALSMFIGIVLPVALLVSVLERYRCRNCHHAWV
jgi:hypothetical protein